MTSSSSSIDDWEEVHPDWWRTPFEDVSWAPSTSTSSRRPNAAAWTASGYIARPLPYTQSRTRVAQAQEQDAGRINPALHGCQGAEAVLAPYEHSTGFHASFWDSSELGPESDSNEWDTLMNDLNPTLTRDKDICAHRLQPTLATISFDPFKVDAPKPIKPKPRSPLKLNAQAAPFVASPATMRLHKDAQGFYSGVEDTAAAAPKRRSKTRTIIENMPRKGYASVLKRGWSQDDLLPEEDGWIGERTRTSQQLFKTLSRHRSESTASTSSSMLDDNDAEFDPSVPMYELQLPLSSPSPTLSQNEDGWIEGLPAIPTTRIAHHKGASASSISSSSSFAPSSPFQNDFWPIYSTTIAH